MENAHFAAINLLICHRCKDYTQNKEIYYIKKYDN